MTVDRRDLLRDIESVAFAARQLRESVDARAPATRVEFDVDRLERAAKTQDESATRVQTFMFEALADSDRRPKDRAAAAEDVLSLAASDLQVGAVLLAAGEVVGELSAPEAAASRAREHLDTAIAALGATSREFAGETDRASMRAFAAEAASRPSADRPSAIAAFEAQARAILDLVTSELGGVVGKITDKISIKDLAGAIADVGLNLPNIDAVGRLVSLAVKKVVNAFKTLASFIGEAAFEALRDPVMKLVERLRDQGFRAILAGLVDVDGTLAYVRIAVSAPGVELAALDRGTAELIALGPRYRQTVKYINIAIGAGVLLNAIAGPTLAILSTVGITLLVLSLLVAVAVAKDFADSENWLRLVRGVREIADDVCAAD